MVLIILIILLSKTTFGNIPTNWSNYVDAIYYINLESRKDRDKRFIGEMKRMNVDMNKVIRINATYNKHGALGCSLSHIGVLSIFMKSGFKNCIIFEDDFVFNQPLEVLNDSFKKFFDNKINYDVCLLAGNVIKQENTNYPFLNKILSSQTTSGYMVNINFAKVLHKNFVDGAKLLSAEYSSGNPDHYSFEQKYSVDQYWKTLMPNNNWFIFNPKLGIQGESYSDIIKNIVSYNTFIAIN